MISARNMFKIFGAKFVENGRYVIDDYYEQVSLAQGHTAGEPAVIALYDPDLDTGTLAAPKGQSGPLATYNSTQIENVAPVHLAHLFGALIPAHITSHAQFSGADHLHPSVNNGLQRYALRALTLT